MARIHWGCRVAVELQFWFLLLSARLVATANDAVVAATNDTVSLGGVNHSVLNVTSGAACRAECTGMTAFDDRMAPVLNVSSINQAQICLAVQVDFELVKCVFKWPATCIAYYSAFDKTRSNCEAVGIDITKQPITSHYTASNCQMCSQQAGASGQKTYWDKPNLTQCEALCSNKDTCTAFDYDATRSHCRTWTGCGPNVQSARFGCQWTVYTRPGFTSPTHAPSATRQPPPSFDFWGTTTSSPDRPADRNTMRAVTSAAVQHRGPVMSCLALLALCLSAPL